MYGLKISAHHHVLQSTGCQLRNAGSLAGEIGSTLVEMAIASAVLLAMIFGIIEVSLAIYAQHFVVEAAREATRYAIVNGSSCTAMPDCGFTDSNTTLLNYVKKLNYPGVDPNRLTVTSTWYYPTPAGTRDPTWTACAVGSTCNAPGDMVKVQVQLPFPIGIPLWNATSINEVSTAQMVISQ
jgi:hypothetical protein